MSLFTPSLKREHKISSGNTTPSSNQNSTDPSLLDKLAAVLPKGYKFSVHHLSTPPTRTDPLCDAPAKERPDKTYQEKHFLAVSIDATNHATTAPKRASPGADEPKEPQTRKPVLIFAIEVFIFTTAYQTTFFVSKADSTGYLQLLNLPKGTPSPIREVCSAFLVYLLQHRRRKNIQSVVNLFARAQAQYLFPGSVENKGKHVLDDWGLLRWWCRTLNPLLNDSPTTDKEEAWGATKGYLMVPGLEEGEMRALVPRNTTQTQAAPKWVVGQHPMERISHYTAEFDWVPPRCLIPKYPDDPKSRFRDELDEEAAKWKQDVGTWKSVKTLAQFWEMMEFRQECSSGRLTGFIWLVFDPKGKEPDATAQSGDDSATPNASFDASAPAPSSQGSTMSSMPPSTPPRRRVDISAGLGRTPQSSPLKGQLLFGSPSSKNNANASFASIASTVDHNEIETEPKKKKKPKLKGLIKPRSPKIKTQQRNYIPRKIAIATPYYYWPNEGRGEKIVDESGYKRVADFLMQLDFSTLEKATSATRRWLSEAGMGGHFGREVMGRMATTSTTFRAGGPLGQVTNLTGLVRKKNAAKDSDGKHTAQASSTETSGTAASSNGASGQGEATNGVKVNVLGAGLVRKKPKLS